MAMWRGWTGDWAGDGLSGDGADEDEYCDPPYCEYCDASELLRDSDGLPTEPTIPLTSRNRSKASMAIQ